MVEYNYKDVYPRYSISGPDGGSLRTRLESETEPDQSPGSITFPKSVNPTQVIEALRVLGIDLGDTDLSTLEYFFIQDDGFRIGFPDIMFSFPVEWDD